MESKVNIEQKQANSLWSSKGKKLNKGRKKNRLNLANQEEKAILVAAELLDSSNKRLNKLRKSRRYIVVDWSVGDGKEESQKQKIAINVNSLAKRVGLSRREILELKKSSEKEGSKEGSFETLIKEKAKLELERALNSEKIIEKVSQRVKEQGKWVGKERRKVLRVLKTAYKTDDFSRKAFFSYNKTFIVEMKENDGKKKVVKSITVEGSDLLGKGGFGRVYSATRFSEEEGVSSDWVLKRSEESNKTQLENEYQILSALHLFSDDKRRVYLQKPPLEVIDFRNGEVGLMAPRFDTDLFKMVKEKRITLKQQLECLLDLSKGLAFLHEQGYVHGDIKTKNCGFQEGDNFRLIDFGGARKLDEINMTDILGIYTPSILHRDIKKEVTRINLIFKKGEKEAKEAKELLKKHDVCCLRIIFLEVLFAEERAVHEGGGYKFNFMSSDQSNQDEILTNEFKKELSDFLSKVLNPLNSDFPTSQEVEEKMEALINPILRQLNPSEDSASSSS